MSKARISQLNCLIAVDKPVGMTSHDVVSRVRRAVGERRVGHAGTLDPLASGVMLIGVGQATRLLGMLTLDTKSYIADIAFGYETSTDDAEGEVTRTAAASVELVREEVARAALEALLGSHMQVPPAFSAISVDGVRSYKRARAGEEVDLPARPIEVLAAGLIAISEHDGAITWTVAFTVSKGTYIRALARDLGRSVGSAAHLEALRRTASGPVGLTSCVALDELDAEVAREHMLDPVAALGATPLEVPARLLEGIRCGKSIDPSEVAFRKPASLEAGATYALVHAGEVVALAVFEGGRLAPRPVFPQPIGGVAR